MPDSYIATADEPQRRNAIRPSGLPIFSTEKLTSAERGELLHLQESFHTAALQIDLCLAIGRVDEALATLQSLTCDLDGRVAAIALTLGSNR